VWSTVRVKSILGVGPKVKDSIKDPFKKETWLGSVHDGLRVVDKGMNTAIGFVSTSALSLDSGFPRFSCPRVVFLFIEFPLRQQISFLFYFQHLRYFVAHEHTLGCLEDIIYFQIVSKIGTLWLRFIS
jgi:hypothetical protein